jgi:ATP-dependent phosphofructokinase / diphosphate-dependent phosphofructokinase
MAAAVIAQGGGPTSVINASLYGVVTESRQREAFTRLLGSQHGIQGVLDGRFVDLFAVGLATLERIRLAPGSALGSSRS